MPGGGPQGPQQSFADKYSQMGQEQLQQNAPSLTPGLLPYAQMGNSLMDLLGQGQLLPGLLGGGSADAGGVDRGFTPFLPPSPAPATNPASPVPAPVSSPSRPGPVYVDPREDIKRFGGR